MAESAPIRQWKLPVARICVSTERIGEGWTTFGGPVDRCAAQTSSTRPATRRYPEQRCFFVDHGDERLDIATINQPELFGVAYQQGQQIGVIMVVDVVVGGECGLAHKGYRAVSHLVADQPDRRDIVTV